CRPLFERRRDRADASNKFRIYISELHVRCHYPAAWRAGANLLRAALFRQHPVERRADYLLRPEKSPWVGTMTHRLASGDERSIILAGDIAWRHRDEPASLAPPCASL